MAPTKKTKRTYKRKTTSEEKQQEQIKIPLHQAVTKGFRSFLEKNKDILICLIIIGIAVFFRVQDNKLFIPLAGHEAQNQVHSASVARNLRDSQFDILHPRIDDQTGVLYENENTESYYFKYFPSYHMIIAVVYRYVPLVSVPLETYGRTTTIMFSLAVIAMLYYLCFKEHSRMLAIMSALVYAVLPYFVYYSQVVLPETTIAAYALFAIIAMYSGLQAKNSLSMIAWYSLSVIIMALAVTTHWYAMVYLLPIIFLFGRKYEFAMFKQFHLYLYFILACVPAIVWHYHIWLNTNNLIPVEVSYTFTEYMHMIFYNILGETVLGIYMTVFAIMGALMKQSKYLLHWIVLAGMGILAIMTIQVNMSEHLLTLLLPMLAIAIGLGVTNIITHYSLFVHPAISFAAVPIIFITGYYLSYEQVKPYYEYSSQKVQMADIIADFTKPDDTIATQTDGDSILLYLANRKGRSMINTSLSHLVQQGYTHVIITSEHDKQALQSQSGDPIFENETFALFPL